MRQMRNPELKVLASAELIARGCVYVISLAPIQAEIGAGWDKAREAVWAHLENLLRQSLAPTDVFCRVDDTAALVSLPSRTPSGAQICCLRIAHELHTVMLGPCDFAKLAIEQAVSLPDGSIGAMPVDLAQVDQSALRMAIALPRGGALPGGADAAGTGPAAPAMEFIHRFIPIWDAQKEAITTYRCHTVPKLSTAERPGSPQQFKLDLSGTILCVRHATQLLSQRLAAGDRFLLWIPVSYEMLRSPVSRIEISALCRSLSSELRPYLIFEIVDLPAGIPQSSLSELVSSLRPFCRSVAAQLPSRIINYSAYLGTGLHAIGLSLAAGTATDTQNEIAKLAAAAQRQHVMSFMLDVPSEELLQSARERGITLLSSPLIGGAIEKPQSVRRLTLETICKRVAAAA